MADKKGFRLEWDTPPAATEVYLYRVDGATPPKTTVGKSGPVVTGGKLILKGNKNQYTDPDVRPGKTYTYVIFAGYGGGQFSPKGVPLTLTVPVPPDPVDRLTGGFDQNRKRVHLEWHNPNPPNRWDSVIVRRRESDGKYNVVSRGKITQLDDSGVEAGRRYIYEVRVVQGEMQSPTRTVELVCKCPVTGFGGQYHAAKGVIKLNWQTPPAATAVHLYRAVGTKEPVVNEQGGKLVAASGDPPLLTDRSNMYADSDIRPGQTYTYLAIAVFGHGTFARSNPVSIRVPKLPDPPSQATAEFDTDSFVIRWKGLKDSNCRYRVYRKPGADAPVSPNDGKLVGDTNQELLRDSTNIKPGVWYAYSVFSVRGDQVSPKPASTPSAGALFALKNVKAKVKGNVVHVDWEAPPSADCVLVAAADTAPPMRFRGTNHRRLPPGGDFSESTAYGSTRGYLVACGYKGLDGKLYISKVYRQIVVVDHPLGTIEDFCAEPDHERGMITCRWSTEGVGQLRIYRLQADHGLVPGSEHDLATLGAFRQAQPEHVGPGEGEWRDTRPDASRPWYCSFLMSRSGNKVRIGPSHRVGIVPPLGPPSIKRKGNGVALMFDWPTFVDLVEVNA